MSLSEYRIVRCERMRAHVALRSAHRSARLFPIRTKASPDASAWRRGVHSFFCHFLYSSLLQSYYCIPLLFFFRCWPHCSSSLLEVTRQEFHRLRDRQPQTYRPRLYVRRAFSQCPVSSFQTFLCVRRAPSRISLTCTGRSSLISYVLPSASTRLVVQRAYKAHGPPRARRHPLPSSSFFPH